MVFIPTGSSIRILGIDPGSRVTGYGIVEKKGASLQFVVCGAIRAGDGKSLADRLMVIHDGLREVIEKHRPDMAAVEEVFMAKNPASALKLGHARGAAMLAAMQKGLSVHEYSARQVKQAVVGYGQAGKGQVQHMVRVLLSLATNPSEDAADALAAAICHANHWDVLGRMRG